MASEVVRLSKMSLESPLVPRSLLNEKRKILGYAYLVSACYTEMNGLTYFKSIMSALFMDPSLVKDLFWGSDRTRFVEFFGFYQRDIHPTIDIWKSTLSQTLMAYKIGPICYRAWYRLPMTLRDGIKQYRKKLWRICPPPVKRAILRVMRFLGFLV